MSLMVKHDTVFTLGIDRQEDEYLWSVQKLKDPAE
jgi:hypothetical protein